MAARAGAPTVAPPATSPREERSRGGETKRRLPAAPTVRPDAVIMLDAGGRPYGAEMERRLVSVAEAARKDDGIFVRLESYVPYSGSPAFDLSRAGQNLQWVRDELQRLGVSPRRMLLSAFGAEHDEELDAQRPWIEIYLIGRVARLPGTGTAAAELSSRTAPPRTP